MKDKKTQYLMMGLAGLLMAAVLWAWLGPQRYSWEEHYEAESKDPYSTQVLLELLRARHAGHSVTVLEKGASLPVDTAAAAEAASYVFVGQGLSMSNDAVFGLLDFVASGNRAFIASQVFPNTLLEYLYGEDEEGGFPDGLYGMSFYPDTAVAAQLLHPDLRLPEAAVFSYAWDFKVQPYYWPYFRDTVLVQFEGLGVLGERLTNFVRVPYGDGFFYLHATPVMFTNYQLKDTARLGYVERALSYLPQGPVYWDEHNRVTATNAGMANDRRSRGLSSRSPLQYILGQPPLAMAWYLLLGAGLLFMVFRARRRQRAIPVPAPNTNTSLAFVNTIGRLYFLQGGHRQLALQKMRFFQIFIRERYHLPSQEWDDDLMGKLAARSQVEEAHIRRIALMHKNILSSRITTENTLTDFYRLIEGFYKRCR